LPGTGAASSVADNGAYATDYAVAGGLRGCARDVENSMRRTRLVAAAIAGSVCLATLAPVAVAEPIADVSPRRVRPGGSVTITVTCPKHDGRVRYVTAYSQAFEKGEADLALVRDASSGRKKATYRGTARITSARHFTGSAGADTSDPFGPNGSFGATDSPSAAGADPGTDLGPDPGSEAGSRFRSGSEETALPAPSYGLDDDSSDDDHSRGPAHHGKRYAINGSCPDGPDFTGSVIVERKPRGGAHAGAGGGQGSVNTAAVAAGGALLAAAVGCGVHTLRRRRPGL
jgi:hypothetical protein